MSIFFRQFVILGLGLIFSVSAWSMGGDKQEEFRRFLGKWNCNAKLAEINGKKGHGYEATLEIKTVLGGKAVMEDYKEKANKEHKTPYSTEGIWGYDSGLGKFTGYNVDGSGTPTVRSSAGWVGDVWTWEVGDGVKFIFTEKLGKTLALEVEVKTKNGQWSNVNKLNCKKQ